MLLTLFYYKEMLFVNNSEYGLFDLVGREHRQLARFVESLQYHSRIMETTRYNRRVCRMSSSVNPSQNQNKTPIRS